MNSEKNYKNQTSLVRVSLTSFYPLCSNTSGRKAISKHNLPPFIDGSCRREPDFQNDDPAITGLCRPRFIKRLRLNDLVIYITNKGDFKEYSQIKGKTRMFIGILKVKEIFESHNDAESWYKERSKEVSQNIICKSTQPLQLDMTGRHCKDKDIDIEIEKWDKQYQDIAKETPRVAICEVYEKHRYLETPPEISEEELEKIFGRIPGTQNPSRLKNGEWERFQSFLDKIVKNH